MNEVEKMYENAGVKPKKECYYWDCPYSTGNIAEDKPMNKRNCKNCSNPNKAVFPPFTAEKQLELIKWLSEQYTITTRYMTTVWFITAETSDVTRTVIKFTVTANTFEEAIASAINHIYLWQDLTKEERKQIKEILE